MQNAEDMDDVRAVYNAGLRGTLSQAPVAAEINGQTVARTSCGAHNFKKAGRGTFEAATVASNKMFAMIEGLR